MEIANWIGFGMMALGFIFNVVYYCKAATKEQRETYFIGSFFAIYLGWLLLMAAIGRG